MGAWQRRSHVFVGLGAMLGGTGAMLNPQGPMGLTTEVLRHGPFETFLIPGLFLFFVLGLGNLFSAFLLKSTWPYRHLVSASMGGILLLWIVIQCLILWSVNGLHVIFFLIGGLQAWWGFKQCKKESFLGRKNGGEEKR